jgi:exopolyphosphatase/guanosine-5'-triphosphate,3'-diphosphate pyrophosphatase
MAKIVPRWEWRAFGRGFGAAETALASTGAVATQESDELYLFSGTGENVKVRDDLMDIKALREVDADGLERWEPVMKAGFPIPAADAAAVFEALHVPPPSMDRPAYTLDQFLTELAEPSGKIRSVRIHKRRTRYTINGCMSELTDVVAEGRPTRTIAVESEDPKAVVAAVRSLGLGGYVNTSYPRAMAILLGDVPARFAVIDVGTNSVKFHVGERLAGGGERTVADRAEITRLGEGLEERGEIGAEPIERTVAAIAGMVAEAGKDGALAIAAVGTEGLRRARNGDEVVAAIRERTGLPVEVVSGEDESRLAYLAVKEGLGLADVPVVVFDTGGGSSQFTFGRGSEVEERFSVPVGAVAYTERFGLAGSVSPDVLGDALAAIAEDLSALDGRPAPDALVGMGGAITNMTAVMLEMATYDPERVQGATLDRAEVDRQLERYRSLDADGRRQIVGLQPKRADVILAGACIVRTVLDKLGQEALRVSDRGLRHGVWLERFGAPR